MRERPGFRTGAIASYLMVGLLGGIIGGLVVGWMMRTGAPPVPSITTAPPYQEAAHATATDTENTVTQAVKLVGPAVVNIDVTSAPAPSRNCIRKPSSAPARAWRC